MEHNAGLEGIVGLDAPSGVRLDFELKVDLTRHKPAIETARLWDVEVGRGPLVGVAVHAGHDIRPELEHALAIAEQTRLRHPLPADFRAL